MALYVKWKEEETDDGNPFVISVISLLCSHTMTLVFKAYGLRIAEIRSRNWYINMTFKGYSWNLRVILIRTSLMA